MGCQVWVSDYLPLGQPDSDISGASTVRHHAGMMPICSSACNIPLEASLSMAEGPAVQAGQAVINFPSFLVPEGVGLQAQTAAVCDVLDVFSRCVLEECDHAATLSGVSKVVKVSGS